MTDPKPDLIAAIASSVRLASTQALDLSFNELLDMWESKELDITPDCKFARNNDPLRGDFRVQ
jgi:hypothetical protein